MKIKRTIKFRITLWFSAFIILLVAIIMLSFHLFIFRSAKKDLIYELKEEVMIASHNYARQLHSEYDDESFTADYYRVGIYDTDGTFIEGRNLDKFNYVPFKSETAQETEYDGKKYLIYDYYKDIRGSDGKWIRGAAHIDFYNYYNSSFLKFIMLLLPLLLITAILGGYLIIKLAFKPINKIIDTANAISKSSDISERIPIAENSPKDELYMMSITLNNMLDKIENQLKREKQITADISHELRTPVSVILSYSEYLSDIAKDNKSKELAAEIEEQTKKVMSLISSLLTLSRLEKGSQPLIIEKIDVGNLLEAVAEGMTDKAAEKGIHIETELEKGITAEGDETLLMSAFINIVDNAVKYGRKDGYIKIKAAKDGKRAVVIIEDNGIGIDEKNIDKIWDRLYREDSARSKEGSGLGLALAKSIIELHKGKICAESVKNNGSIFKIIL